MRNMCVRGEERCVRERDESLLIKSTGIMKIYFQRHPFTIIIKTQLINFKK